METYNGHEIIGKEVLYQQGCFTRTAYWLRGWVPGLTGINHYIWGHTGRETTIVVDAIKAISTVG